MSCSICIFITVLSITEFLLLALAVILRHEALGVLPGVDGDGAELPVLHLPGPGGLHVRHGAGGEHRRVAGGRRPRHVVHRVREVSVVNNRGRRPALDKGGALKLDIGALAEGDTVGDTRNKLGPDINKKDYFWLNFLAPGSQMIASLSVSLTKVCLFSSLCLSRLKSILGHRRECYLESELVSSESLSEGMPQKS